MTTGQFTDFPIDWQDEAELDRLNAVSPTATTELFVFEDGIEKALNIDLLPGGTEPGPGIDTTAIHHDTASEYPLAAGGFVGNLPGDATLLAELADGTKVFTQANQFLVSTGEQNTQTNIGGGIEIGLPKSGLDLPIRTLSTQFQINAGNSDLIELSPNSVTSTELADLSVDTAAVQEDAITNVLLANMAANTIKGSQAGGDPADLDAATVRGIINVADGATASPDAYQWSVADQFGNVPYISNPSPADRIPVENSQTGLIKGYTTVADVQAGGTGEINSATSLGGGIDIAINTNSGTFIPVRTLSTQFSVLADLISITSDTLASETLAHVDQELVSDRNIDGKTLQSLSIVNCTSLSVAATPVVSIEGTTSTYIKGTTTLTLDAPGSLELITAATSSASVGDVLTVTAKLGTPDRLVVDAQPLPPQLTQRAVGIATGVTLAAGQLCALDAAGDAVLAVNTSASARAFLRVASVTGGGVGPTDQAVVEYREFKQPATVWDITDGGAATNSRIGVLGDDGWPAHNPTSVTDPTEVIAYYITDDSGDAVFADTRSYQPLDPSGAGRDYDGSTVATVADLPGDATFGEEVFVTSTQLWWINAEGIWTVKDFETTGTVAPATHFTEPQQGTNYTLTNGVDTLASWYYDGSDWLEISTPGRTVVTLADGIVQWDGTLYHSAEITLTKNSVIELTGGNYSGGTLKVLQDATGGHSLDIYHHTGVNDGTLQSESWALDHPYLTGGSSLINGADAQIQIVNGSDLSPQATGDRYNVEFWMKRTGDADNNRPLVSLNVSGRGFEFYINASQGFAYQHVGSGAGIVAFPNYTIPLDTWIKVRYRSQSGVGQTVYVNDAVVDTLPDTAFLLPTAPGDLRFAQAGIGPYLQTDCKYWPGTYDADPPVHWPVYEGVGVAAYNVADGTNVIGGFPNSPSATAVYDCRHAATLPVTIKRTIDNASAISTADYPGNSQMTLQSAIDDAFELGLDVSVNTQINMQDHVYVYGNVSLLGAGNGELLFDSDFNTLSTNGQFAVVFGIKAFGETLNDTNKWTGSVKGLKVTGTQNAKLFQLFYLIHFDGVIFEDNKCTFDFPLGLAADDRLRRFLGANVPQGWHSGAQTKQNATVSGNDMRTVSYDSSGGEGMSFTEATNVVFSNNLVYGVGDDPIAFHHCNKCWALHNDVASVNGRILFEHTQDVVIAHNRLEHVADLDGVWGTDNAHIASTLVSQTNWQDNQRFAIHDNIIYQPPGSTTGTISAILIRGGQGGTIHNNICKNDATNNMQIQIQPFTVSGWTGSADADDTSRPRRIDLRDNIGDGSGPVNLVVSGTADGWLGPNWIATPGGGPPQVYNTGQLVRQTDLNDGRVYGWRAPTQITAEEQWDATEQAKWVREPLNSGARLSGNLFDNYNVASSIPVVLSDARTRAGDGAGNANLPGFAIKPAARLDWNVVLPAEAGSAGHFMTYLDAGEFYFPDNGRMMHALVWAGGDPGLFNLQIYVNDVQIKSQAANSATVRRIDWRAVAEDFTFYRDDKLTVRLLTGGGGVTGPNNVVVQIGVLYDV